MTSPTLYVTGGTGFVGSALVKAWLSQSREHRAVIQTREVPSDSDHEKVVYVRNYGECEGPVDALVNLAGAGIADSRWTVSRKQELADSRVALTASLFEHVAQGPRPGVVISASAIGFYGTAEAEKTESSDLGEGFAAELCRDWESSAEPFGDIARLIVLRLGVVLGQGGALKKLLPLYRLGLGGPIGGGQQWFSWIHLADVVSVILTAIANDKWSGVYNVTAPQAVRQAGFATTLGHVLKRPSLLPTPPLALKLAYGKMAEELLIQGQRVAPERLKSEGYAFKYPLLKNALEDIVQAKR